jgi:hypothetical protein
LKAVPNVPHGLTIEHRHEPGKEINQFPALTKHATTVDFSKRGDFELVLTNETFERAMIPDL